MLHKGTTKTPVKILRCFTASFPRCEWMGFFHQGTSGLVLAKKHPVEMRKRQAPSFQNLLLVLGARNLFVDLLRFDSRSWKIITFFSDCDVTVRIKGFSRYYFMIQLPWLTGLHKYETPKKGYTKKRRKDILFEGVIKKENQHTKITKVVPKVNQGGQTMNKWTTNQGGLVLAEDAAALLHGLQRGGDVYLRHDWISIVMIPI